MTTTHTIIIQALLGVVQIANLATSVVPDKWKPVVAGLAAAASIFEAKLAHSWNPDGTPATTGYVKG